MVFDVQLRLLELTNSRPSVRLNELRAVPKRGIDEAVDALRESGLLDLSDGVLTMDARQRVMLAEQLVHSGADAKRISRSLRWQEFEDFADKILLDNRFFTRKHFVYKCSGRRREIDILAWNDMFLFAVDCKHWLRSLSTGRMKEAARAQTERVTALAERPELLHRLKVPNPEGRGIIPVILTLGELRQQSIDGVPIVSVSRLVSFIYGVSPIDLKLKHVRVDSSSQSRLA